MAKEPLWIYHHKFSDYKFKLCGFMKIIAKGILRQQVEFTQVAFWALYWECTFLLQAAFLHVQRVIENAILPSRWSVGFLFTWLKKCSFPILLFMNIILPVNISFFFICLINFFLFRCNLAPVVEFAADVGTKSDFITMNPSVVQRAFGGFRNESDREKFVHRLSMLNDSVLWIPAFMVKGGEKHVEWVNALILKNKLKVRTAYPSLRLIHAVRG